MTEFKVILVSKDKDEPVKEWAIVEGKKYVIGRSTEKSDITIADGTISRVHAEIEASKSGKIYLRDLDSANGTFIEGENAKPKRAYKLMPGENFSLGDLKDTLQVKGKLLLTKENKERKRSKSAKKDSEAERGKRKSPKRKKSPPAKRKSRERSRHRSHEARWKEDRREKSKEKTKQDNEVKKEIRSRPETKLKEEKNRFHYEEFLKLKEAEKQEVKSKLPKLIENQPFPKENEGRNKVHSPRKRRETQPSNGDRARIRRD